jgi:hypothetical protein
VVLKDQSVFLFRVKQSKEVLQNIRDYSTSDTVSYPKTYITSNTAVRTSDLFL